MTSASIAWTSRWQAVRPNATYNETWGLEGAWRQNADTWGYPLEDSEQSIDQDGQQVPGRTFSKVGLVVWLSSGPSVIGWP